MPTLTFCSFLIIFFGLLYSCVAAQLNETVVEAFLDCIAYHDENNLLYAVDSTGALVLTLPANAPSCGNEHKQAFSPCNQLFGLAFNISFEYGRYIEDEVLDFQPISGVNAHDLAIQGLKAREVYNVTNGGASSNFTVFAAYLDYVRNAGYIEHQIMSVANVTLNDVFMPPSKKDI